MTNYDRYLAQASRLATTSHDRYLNCVARLAQRYSRGGKLIISVGGKPSRYARLEAMAAVKYLGCDPAKMGGALS